MDNKKFLMQVGNRIYQARTSRGLTQENLAEMMDVSVQMVSNLECGRKAIRPENLVKLCDALNISADYVLFGKLTPHNISHVLEIANKIANLSEKDRKMIEMLVDYCSK